MQKLSYIIIGIIITLGCSHNEHHKEELLKLRVTNPVQRDTTLFKEYVCHIRSIQHIEIRALEKGYLEKIFVDEGQFVKKGQLLFQILPTIYQAELQKAEAEVQYTEIEYQNTKRLADSNIVSQSELALAKAKLAKAKADLELTKAHLSFTQIRAPFDGMLGRFKDIRIGSLLEEGELLTTLSDNSKLWVYFNVPENEYLDFVTNHVPIKQRRVKLRMANQQLFEHEGTIEVIEADFDHETGNIAFRATFPNPQNILRNDETGVVLVPFPAQKAIIIPQSAAFEVLEKKFVFLVDKDNKVHQQEIQVQTELPHLYLVKKGISPQKTILVEGLNRVKDGEKIQPVHVNLDTFLNEVKHIHAE